jgi:glycerol-3-phosphate acyltransferase PlsY
MQALYISVALLAAYLIGSLSFAVIVSRLMGLADPRSYGSKNPGATNVLRSGNKAAAVLTLALDALKGYVPVLLVLVFGPRFGLGETTAAFVGLAAFVGHLWPVFFKLPGRQGRGHGSRRAAGHQPLVGRGHAADLAHRGGLLPLLVAGVAGRGGFAPFYQALIWGLEPVLVALIGMSLLLVWRHQATSQAAGRHRKQARPEGAADPIGTGSIP